MASVAAFLAVLAPLRLTPDDWRRAVLTGVVSVLGVAAFCVLLDATLFHPSADYVAFYTSPLWPRTGFMCALALVEELKFRLLLMTALVLLGNAVRRPVPAPWIIGAIILSQLAGVWPLVLAAPLYASLRFWLVGCVWGWLYWKHGWVTGAFAHMSTHLLLDPMLLIVL